MFAFLHPFPMDSYLTMCSFIAAWLVAMQSLFCILHKLWCLHKTKKCFVFYEKASIWWVFIEPCFLNGGEVLIGNWEREEFGVGRINMDSVRL